MKINKCVCESGRERRREIQNFISSHFVMDYINWRHCVQDFWFLTQYSMFILPFQNKHFFKFLDNLVNKPLIWSVNFNVQKISNEDNCRFCRHSNYTEGYAEWGQWFIMVFASQQVFPMVKRHRFILQVDILPSSFAYTYQTILESYLTS